MLPVIHFRLPILSRKTREPHDWPLQLIELERIVYQAPYEPVENKANFVGKRNQAIIFRLFTVN